MTLENLVVLFLQSGIVLGLAFVAVRFAMRAPAVRLAICRVALLATLALLALQPWMGQRLRPVVPIDFGSLEAPAPLGSSLPSLPRPAARVPEPSIPTGTFDLAVAPAYEPSVPEPTSPLTRVVAWGRFALPIWVTGSALFGLGLAFGLLQLARIRRRCTPVTDAKMLGILAACAKQASIKPPRIVECAEPAGLFVGGILRPAIFIPRRMLDSLDEQDLAAVLSHEIAHIANGDLVWWAVRRFLTVVLWWQPLVWLLRSPMEAAAEELCDRHVLATGVSQRRYADCLLRLRESPVGRAYPALAIGAVSARSSLGARIESILDPARSRAIRLSRATFAAIVAGAFIVSVGAPMVFARPATLPDQHPDKPGLITHPYSGSIRIVDRRGRPVIGASAWLVVSGPGHAKPIPLRVAGDTVELESGDAPPESRGTLVVRAPALAAGFETVWPAAKQIDHIVLEEPHTISGRIVLRNGSPVAGLKLAPVILVRIEGTTTRTLWSVADLSEIGLLGLFAQTDAAGRFAIPDLPGRTIVLVDHADNRYSSIRNEVRFATPAKGNNPETKITIDAAAQVSGLVTRDGLPVPGVRVGAQSQSGGSKWGEAVTDAQGRYLIRRLSSGTYNVAVDLPAPLEKEVTARAAEGVPVRAGQTIDIPFSLVPGAQIQGRVLDQQGQALGKVQIGIYGPAHPSSGAWVQTTETDTSGRYRARVPAGKQYVYVMGGAPGVCEVHTTVADRSTNVVDLRLQPRSADDPAPGGPPATPATGEVQNDTAAPAPPVRTPPVMAFGPGKPFYGPAKLPNGAVVRLAFVQDDANGPHTPWAPDGSPASAADVTRSLDMHDFAMRRTLEPRSLYLRVDIAGVKRGDFDCVVKVPHPSDWNPWQSYGDEHGRTLDMASFRAPTTLRRTDMKFGVAAGPLYRYIAKSVMGVAPLFARPGASTQFPAEFGKVTIRFPEKFEGTDAQLDAYDASGKRLEPAWRQDTQVDPKTGERTRSYGFRGATDQEIANVILLVRDYQWVTFRGIHLYPDGGSLKP